MAKYDDKRSRNLQNYNQNRGEQLFNNASQFLGAQGQQFQQDYGQARQSDTSMRDSAMKGFQNFADTGGFTPTGIAAMRSRAISPIRAAYSNAQRNVERQQAMGGTSAGHNTLMARMAREQGQAASDATTNTEAGIAQMIQQGKLAGNQGINQLYGTTPAESNLFARSVLENANQGLQLTGMENNRMAGLLNNQTELTRAPGTSDSVWNNVNNAANLGANIGRRIFAPLTSAKPDNINV